MNRITASSVAVIGLLCSAVTIARADSFVTVANQLAKGALKSRMGKIAVLTFTYRDGAVSSGSTLVAEGLTTRLVGRQGFQVIERAELDQLLAESKLALSGAVDASTTQRLGKILGVDAIVMGKLVDLNTGYTTVHARLVSTTNGAVLAAAAMQLKRTWYDPPRLPNSTTDNAYAPDAR